jgi:hypothetical protein
MRRPEDATIAGMAIRLRRIVDVVPFARPAPVIVAEDLMRLNAMMARTSHAVTRMLPSATAGR